MQGYAAGGQPAKRATAQHRATRPSLRSARLKAQKSLRETASFWGLFPPTKQTQIALRVPTASTGADYSLTSIFCNYGSYGSTYGTMSPFCSYATEPPKIFTLNGQWAYLTVNKSLNHAISPYLVMAAIHGKRIGGKCVRCRFSFHQIGGVPWKPFVEIPQSFRGKLVEIP